MQFRCTDMYLEGCNACSQLDIHQEYSCSYEGHKTLSHQTSIISYKRSRKMCVWECLILKKLSAALPQIAFRFWALNPDSPELLIIQNIYSATIFLTIEYYFIVVCRIINYTYICTWQLSKQCMLSSCFTGSDLIFVSHIGINSDISPDG